jgi:hypothetical protein
MAVRLAIIALVLLAAEEPKRLTLDLEDVTLETVAKTVARRTGVRVEIAPTAAAVRVTIHAERRTAEEVLREAAKQAGVPFVALPDDTFLLGTRAAPSSERVRHAVETTQVDLHVRNVVLEEILDDLSQQVRVPFVLDVKAPRTIRTHRASLQFRAMSAQKVLQILGAWYRLEHDARWGAMIVTAQGELAKMPARLVPVPKTKPSEKDRVARGQLAATPVGFRVEQMPLPNVLVLVSRLTSVKIDVRPGAAEALSPVKITWQVRDVPAEAVLVLLLSRRGLRCRLADGVLVVESATGTAARDKKR